MLLIISQIFTWLFFISLLLWWAGICSLTECLLRPVHQEGRSCLCDRFSLIHESNFSHNMRGYLYWNTGSVLAGAWLGTPPPCLYISIIKHFVLLLLYRNSRPNFDKKKTPTKITPFVWPACLSIEKVTYFDFRIDWKFPSTIVLE